MKTINTKKFNEEFKRTGGGGTRCFIPTPESGVAELEFLSNLMEVEYGEEDMFGKVREYEDRDGHPHSIVQARVKVTGGQDDEGNPYNGTECILWIHNPDFRTFQNLAKSVEDEGLDLSELIGTIWEIECPKPFIGVWRYVGKSEGGTGKEISEEQIKEATKILYDKTNNGLKPISKTNLAVSLSIGPFDKDEIEATIDKLISEKIIKVNEKGSLDVIKKL